MNNNIDRILLAHKDFDSTVYTNIHDAIRELDKRKNDINIDKYIDKLVPNGVPRFLNGKKHAFLSRDLATPNYETRRFVSIVNALGSDIIPLFWEYHDDKFTPNVNPSKYNLARNTFYLGLDKRGSEKTRSFTVVDFNKYNGKRISEVKTVWNQSLVDYHHELIKENYLSIVHSDFISFDASAWYRELGGDTSFYYKRILALFLKHGILFENFVISDKVEFEFTKNIFLPAFIEIYNETGIKPLIVALEPTNMESDNFWMYYPHDMINLIKGKLNLL